MRQAFIFTTLLFISASGYGQVQYIDSLKRAIKNYDSSDTTYINILNEIALTYWSINSDSVLKLSTKSLDLATKLNYLKGQAEATKNIGVASWMKGDYQKALDYYHKAIPLAEKANYLKGLSGCYNNIAILYNNQGKYNEALPYHTKALQIRERIGDKKAIATSLNNIGVIYEQLGQYGVALDYQFKGLRIREDIKDRFGISMSFNNIANLYGHQQQYDKALEFQFSALKIREELGDYQGIVQSLDNLGNINSRQRKDSLALFYFLKAFEIQEAQLKDEYIASHLLLNIADIHLRKGNIVQAEDYYNKARVKMETIKDKNGLIGVLFGLAEVKLHYKKHSEAISLALESLRLSVEIKHRERIVEAHSLLSSLYERIHKSQEALFHYKQYKVYSDSLLNSETQKKTAQLQAQYEYQKKEVQLKEEQRQLELNYEKKAARQRLIILAIVLVLASVSTIAVLVIKSRQRLQSAYTKLEEANTLIKSQNKELELMNSLKERLLSIVSHDARGPLNSLRSMLGLVSKDAVSLSEAKSILSSLNAQVGHVTDFLETLLHWVKNQFTQVKPEISDFDLNPVTSQVISLLAPIAAVKKINIDAHLPEKILVRADQEMIRTVMRNLISNAIKFSNESDKIDVLAQPFDQDYIKVMVNDTGVGIPEGNLLKLMGADSLSTRGTNSEVGTGIGLQLCRQFVEMNNGKFGLVSEAGKGSSFWFTLPAANSKAG